MLAYAVKRILLCIPTLFGIILITFIVINLAPGNPVFNGASVTSDHAITPQVYEQLRVRYHLDVPCHVRFFQWCGDLLRLDFGRSFHDGRDVLELIAERAPATLLLTGLAIFFSFLISVPIGFWTAFHAGGWADRIIGGLCFGIYAIPRYVMGMLLIVVVGVKLEWLPFMGIKSDGYAAMSGLDKLVDLLRHSLLIGICFMYPLVAYQVRFVRDNVCEVLETDYIRTARAKGLSPSAIAVNHIFPNTLMPLLTMFGMMLPMILGGAVILEVMFSWPGMGRLFFESIMRRDYPVIMAVSFLSAIIVLLGTLVVDLLYAAVDPRVRYS